MRVIEKQPSPKIRTATLEFALHILASQGGVAFFSAAAPSIADSFPSSVTSGAGAFLRRLLDLATDKNVDVRRAGGAGLTLAYTLCKEATLHQLFELPPQIQAPLRKILESQVQSQLAGAPFLFLFLSYIFILIFFLSLFLSSFTWSGVYRSLTLLAVFCTKRCLFLFLRFRSSPNTTFTHGSHRNGRRSIRLTAIASCTAADK